MADIVDLHPDREPLKKGGGDGTYNPMEQRVSKLETDAAFMRGKLEDMPTKDWMTTRLFFVVGAVVALSALIQIVIQVLNTQPPAG
jgi:hypothetical protein